MKRNQIMRHSSAEYRRDPTGKVYRRQKLCGLFGYHFGYSLAFKKSSCRQEGLFLPSSRSLLRVPHFLCGYRRKRNRAVTLCWSHKPILTVLISSKDIHQLLLACSCITAQPVARSCSLKLFQCIVFCKTTSVAL